MTAKLCPRKTYRAKILQALLTFFIVFSSVSFAFAQSESASYVFVQTSGSKRLTPSAAPAYVQSTLLRVRDEYTRIFSLDRAPSVQLRFVGSNSGLPRFARALFFEGDIFIPVPPEGEQALVLERAVRHEYAHAVVRQLTDGRAPAWLDEGLAQYFEGITPLEEKRMAEALGSTSCDDVPLELHQLEHGFTVLSEPCARRAYAYSYRVVRELILRQGMKKMLAYLTSLKNGQDIDLAFQDVFALSWVGFQEEVRRLMGKLAKSAA